MRLTALLLVLALPRPSPAQDIAGHIAAAFQDHRVVAIGENHGHQELHGLLVDVLGDPEIMAVVDDIVVEFGNALYQPLVDRYIRGEPVPPDSVRLAWRNTVVSPSDVWDSPVYERFYAAVRRINETRRDGRAYRLVLGDTPVDWDRVVSREDLASFYDRSEHMAATVVREVLRDGRRALLIAGGAHLTRANMVRRNPAGVPVAEVSVVSRLAQQYPGTLYVIRSLGRVGSVDLGDVLPDVGPVLRSTSYPPIAGLPANGISTMRNADGSPFSAYGDATLQDLVDAVILWPASQRTFVGPEAGVYDDAYQTELDRRSRIVRGLGESRP